MSFQFSVVEKLKKGLGRAGRIETSHGVIETPAFIVVGTKATVKALTPEMLTELGAQAVLSNTYHLYLEPTDAIVKAAGGLHTFMHWDKPMFTDSGGFQAFSLGAAFGTSVTKLAGTVKKITSSESARSAGDAPLATITEEGVQFKSHRDGSIHFFTPEKSIEIQHNLGADILFAFDECTSPTADKAYQKEAMDRTHRWAKRSLDFHKSKKTDQALFGIVQGGRFQDLREESAKIISGMDFDGFGIGGSFDKTDIGTAVSWVNTHLPEEKPRHLLGIGEPEDLFLAIEYGCDTFDCVSPTRIARNGTLYTKDGKMHLENAQFRNDFTPIESDCECYTCKNYTKAYLAHLSRSGELTGYTLNSIHNVHFIVNLVEKMRRSILDGTFFDFRDAFLRRYGSKE